MKNRFLIIAFLACLGMVLAQACKKNVVVRPVERYIHMASTAPSTLQVPIVIEREALVGLVNEQMPMELLQEDNFQGFGVALTVRRSGDLAMAFRQNPEQKEGPGTLHYEVPLQIDVARNALITTLKANGTLNLRFATTVEIGRDWKVKSNTVLEGHKWIKTPELSFGPVNIPINGLTSKLIQRMEGRITSEIDAGIQQNVDLKTALAPLYKDMGLPKILSEEFAGYLVANPEAIGLGALVEDNGGMATTLELALRPKLGLGAPPVGYPAELPDNSGISKAATEFELSIQSLLGFEAMRGVLAKALLDTTLSQAGRSATVKEVELYGQDERLVIGLRMVGDYTGWAYLRAQPVYDADSERMELRNIDVTLDTKNILYKSIGYLFQNRIRKEINKQIGDQVAAQLTGVRDEINSQLSGKEVTPGIRVEGAAHKVSIVESLVTPEGLSAEIRFGGSLSVRVKRIPTE